MAKCDMLLNKTDLRLGVDFTTIFTLNFYVHRSQKRKNTVKSSVSFCAFGAFAQKSCLLNIGEIDPSSKIRKVSL